MTTRRQLFRAAFAAIAAAVMPKPKMADGYNFSGLKPPVPMFFPARPPMYSFFYDPTDQPMFEMWPKPLSDLTAKAIIDQAIKNCRDLGDSPEQSYRKLNLMLDDWAICRTSGCRDSLPRQS